MYKIKDLFKLLIFGFILLTTHSFAQQDYQAATVAFYNVENLFDTEVSAGYIDGTRSYDDPLYHISIPAADIDKYEHEPFSGEYTYENIAGKKIIRPLILQAEEFSPNGNKRWTQDRYDRKAFQLAKVLSELGRDDTGNAPVIIGLCEIETIQNVEDIVNQPPLKQYDYGVVHFNSFDARGVDVGFAYQKSRFVVTKAMPYVIKIYNNDDRRIYTRDILRVTGLLDGEEITFLVNHWPSRSGGEKRSAPNRKASAEVMKGIYDEIRAENPEAKIIAMGDFNDDPTSPSIKEIMGSKGDKNKIKPGDIYNPMEKMHKKGLGTLAYRDAWNLFDQFLVTHSLVEQDKNYDSYKLYKTEIYNPPYLHSPDGPYKGYPYRMYGGDTFYPNGYSDHFPVYTILLRKKK